MAGKCFWCHANTKKQEAPPRNVVPSPWQQMRQQQCRPQDWGCSPWALVGFHGLCPWPCLCTGQRDCRRQEGQPTRVEGWGLTLAVYLTSRGFFYCKLTLRFRSVWRFCQTLDSRMEMLSMTQCANAEQRQRKGFICELWTWLCFTRRQRDLRFKSWTEPTQLQG